MQRLVLTAALVGCLGAAGCAPSVSEKLVGKWRYDALDQAQQDIREQGGGGAMEVLLGVAQAAGMKAGMEIEFRDDQTATMSASLFATKTSGPLRWEVVEQEGDAMTVELRPTGDQDARRLQITFIDQDHFRYAPPGAGAEPLVFARVRQE